MMKILVVDDISVNIEAVKSILSVYMPEYEIITAQSGKDGLELAHKELPEVILLDYLMPKMNGFEVCEKLKESEKTKKIPVLMVSALGDSPNVRTQGLIAGADAFISKPFDIREFVALIKVMLRIKNAEDQLRQRNEELEVFIKKQTRHYNDSEERFLQISKHAREFFWEVDENLSFTFVSKSMETMLGHSVSDLLENFHLYDLAKNTQEELIKNEIVVTVSNKEILTDKEVSFLNKDGSTVWLAINGFPIYDHSNRYEGYRGVCDDITRRKQAEAHLNQSMDEIKTYQQKLKKLNKELTQAEEKERKRIAEYLHDGIGQNLALAFMNLSAIAQSEVSDDIKTTLTNTTRLINNAISETRLLTYDLSPPILYELGFLSAVKWKLDQVKNEFNLSTTFEDNGITLNFNAETSISLYRIVCELLNNTIKHAKASLINIELKQANQYFQIIVSDNGAGFDIKKLEKNDDTNTFGLFSITERLDAFNGFMKVKTAIGQGTSTIISIPQLINE